MNQRVTLFAVGLALGLPLNAAERQASIGVPPWQGAEAKTAVVAEILEILGYDVSLTSAAAPLVFQELAQGRLDFNLSAWKPGQDGAFGPYVDDGDIVILGENLTGAETGLAVPASLREAGIRSLEDLAEHGERFDHTIYCIEPGSGAEAVAGEAIESDLYGLGDWTLLPSSTEGMLVEVGRAIERDRAIVFCGWAPHWMNISYDIHYLEDPLAHWGEPGETRVFTLARAGLEADDPDLARFLSQFRVEANVQSDWIHATARDERPLEQMARSWIRENLDQVGTWLDGVRSVGGSEAFEVVSKEFQPQQ